MNVSVAAFLCAAHKAIAAVNPAAGTSVWNGDADSAAGLRLNGKSFGGRESEEVDPRSYLVIL